MVHAFWQFLVCIDIGVPWWIFVGSSFLSHLEYCDLLDLWNISCGLWQGEKLYILHTIRLQGLQMGFMSIANYQNLAFSLPYIRKYSCVIDCRKYVFVICFCALIYIFCLDTCFDKKYPPFLKKFIWKIIWHSVSMQILSRIVFTQLI